jgi:N-acetylmuramic acid 6-phosphate etherase
MSTETHDPRFVEIDEWPTSLAVAAMLEGQLAAIASVYSQIDRIAAAADAASAKMLDGGRSVYVGAGTSGRIAVQDGVELSPTYDWPSERLVFLLAGGLNALAESVEGAEDDEEDARAQVDGANLTANDVVIGVAASGRTKFTVAAIERARAHGALTIGLANNPGSLLLDAAEHPILADTGSELIAGSTRMKAGTTQKAVLNVLSTAIMVRCGLVFRGLMVNMRVSNEKLALRARAIVQELADVTDAAAEAALAAADNDIRKAVLIASGVRPENVGTLLSANRGNLRAALADTSSEQA